MIEEGSVLTSKEEDAVLIGSTEEVNKAKQTELKS